MSFKASYWPPTTLAVKPFAPLAMLCALVAAAGCGSTDSQRSGQTATSPAETTPAPTTVAAPSTPSVWAGDVDTLGLGAAPAFPEALDGWTSDGDQWSLTIRAFPDQWSPMSAPKYEDYPATMNGCDSGLSLVRWRVIAKGRKIRASWQGATAAEGVAMGDSLTGDRGWMILDGCQIPQFQFISADDESTLADVSVTAKKYTPTA